MGFTQHKVSSNVNDKMFSDFIKKEKTLYQGSSVFGRLTEYISTLVFNPNLVRGCAFDFVEIFHFLEIQFSYCLYLQKDLKPLNLNLIL